MLFLQQYAFILKKEQDGNDVLHSVSFTPRKMYSLQYKHGDWWHCFNKKQRFSVFSDGDVWFVEVFEIGVVL